MNNYIEAGFPCMQVPSMHGSLRISGQLQTAVPVSVAQNVELYLHLHFPVGSYITIIFIPDKEQTYRTAQLNTGHLAIDPEDDLDDSLRDMQREIYAWRLIAIELESSNKSFVIL